ncbi:uncharacterized protein PHALS_06416 [Plasmopara halstedii]|uniref:Uncharacterized protein n=1 Tax=Plasmopara halstedii TaxID=4781 RepID=A0A0N7L814_PLAHL|nr:uncharacterized protein PHALS_06416 [Plasmopara halstedii]CEG48603.1 hypothetical protein PHALS_06416 [Plasmopara halstedii]|eukprot:XP_024584972.1 hypothetical protein PHALS_06416 [Plasmopara halstedii]
MNSDFTLLPLHCVERRRVGHNDRNYPGTVFTTGPKILMCWGSSQKPKKMRMSRNVDSYEGSISLAICDSNGNGDSSRSFDILDVDEILLVKKRLLKVC